MKIFNLIVCFIGLLSISCATRQKGTTTAPSTPDTTCQGVTWQGKCYSGPDQDADGAPASLEAAFGTSDTIKDTDGDGANDFCEILYSTDPKNPQAKPQDCPTSSQTSFVTDDEGVKAACMLYNEQKKQNSFLNEMASPKVTCTSESVVSCSALTGEDKKSCEDNLSVSKCVVEETGMPNDKTIINPEYFGLEDEAEIEKIEVTVEWYVSYRDILIISNNQMIIKPWYGYHDELIEASDWYSLLDVPVYGWLVDIFVDAPDDQRYDHALGYEPALSPHCAAKDNTIKEDKEKLYKRAKVTSKIVGKGEKQEGTWWMPSYVPYKIINYSQNIHPLSFDGITVATRDTGVTLESWATNNQSFRTFVISVSEANKMSRTELLFNNHCAKRKVEFTVEYYKSKDQELSLYESGINMDEICSEVSK